MRKGRWLRRRRPILGISLPLLTLVWGGACELFPFSPHQVWLNESQQDLTRKNLQHIKALPPRESFKFAVLGDVQQYLTEARDAIPVLNRQEDIEFVIQVGDITDFGFAKEFLWTHQILARLKAPLLVVIGNHDLLSNGKAIYKKMYGPTDFAFLYGRTKFVLLDTNSREYGFNGRIPDLGWLESQLEMDGSWDRAVVVSHVPPTNPDFDPDLAEKFAATLRRNGVVLSLHGHVHDFSDRLPFDDGVRYVTADSVSGRNFLVISVGPDKLDVDRIFY